jgi:hypothetical protein
MVFAERRGLLEGFWPFNRKPQACALHHNTRARLRLAVKR